MSLDAALQQAMQNSLNLEAARARLEARESAVKWSGALAEPMLSLEASNYSLDELSSQGSDMTGNVVKVSQLLPFPGKRSTRREAARHRAVAQAASLEDLRSMLRREVRTAYYEVYLADVALKIKKEKLIVIQSAADAALAKYQSGGAAQSDVLGMQSEVAMQLEEISEAESELAMSQEDLKYLLGGKLEAEAFRVEAPTRAVCSEGNNAEALFEVAKSGQPKLKELNAMLSAAGSETELRRLDSNPDIEFMLSYMRRDGAMAESGRDLVSAGVSINLPIWQEDRQLARLSAARSEESRVRAQLGDSERKLRTEVNQALLKQATAKRRLDLLEKGRKVLLRQAADAAGNEYQSGMGSVEMLLSAITKRFEAELAWHAALADCAKGAAEILYLKGE